MATVTPLPCATYGSAALFGDPPRRPSRTNTASKSVGVWCQTIPSAEGTKPAPITMELQTITRQVHRAPGSAATLSGVLIGAVIVKLPTMGVFPNGP